MLKTYAPLQNYPLKSGSTFAHPVQSLPQRVKLSNSALDVMTDANKVSVLCIHANRSMQRANEKMIRYGVRMLLVLDDHEEIAGLITATDVLGEKPVRFLKNMGGTNADILVSDIMTARPELEVMKFEDVQHASVGQIVATLKRSNRQHAMVVVEGSDGRQTIRGLFSATQIARQLGAQAQSFELARTFAEIEAVIAKD